MKIFIKHQLHRFPIHLQRLKTAKCIPYEKKQLHHKIDRIQLDCDFLDYDFSRLFHYQIFPSSILCAYPEWLTEQRKMQTGDTIVQQINIPPFDSFAQRIIVGVRVTHVINEANCKGFAYETLKGHVEKGISFFRIENQNNRAVFTIETYSAPALLPGRLLSPLSSWYQHYCTRRALHNMKCTAL